MKPYSCNNAFHLSPSGLTFKKGIITMGYKLWLQFVFCFLFSGAFGVVHRCIEKSTGRCFVGKFVNTPQPNDKNTVRNEIGIMNQLHHPRLLNLHDAFEDQHEMVLILE